MIRQREAVFTFTERRRGHRHVGGQLGHGARERHLVVAGVLVALAGAASAYAGWRASKAQEQQQRYQSKIAKNQAQQAQYNAQIAAANQHIKNLRVMGQQRAALGASGVMSTEGSPLFVQMDTFEQGILEEQRLKYGGQVRADQLISESRYLTHQATQTRELGYINAGASLLGTAAKAYSVGSGYQSSESPSANTDYGSGYRSYRSGERQSYR